MNFLLHTSSWLAPRRLNAVCVGLLGLTLSLAWLDAAQAQAPKTKHAEHASKKSKKKPAHSSASTRKHPGKKTAAAPGTSLNQNPEVSIWAQDAARRLQLDADWVQKTIAQTQRLPVIEKWVLPPTSPVAKDWSAYRARFIEPVRIQAGLRFWQKHRDTLDRAEREYGVPAAIIVGIIGVETLYGQNTGNFRVVDALGTLAFHFPQAHTLLIHISLNKTDGFFIELILQGPFFHFCSIDRKQTCKTYPKLGVGIFQVFLNS